MGLRRFFASKQSIIPSSGNTLGDPYINNLVSAWDMDESVGGRVNKIYPKQFLYEAHGKVYGEAGKVGNAFRPIIDPSDRDYRSYGEWLRSTPYANWYPLGGTFIPEVQEESLGANISGTICVIFKPETGINTTGQHFLGGLVSFNSFPYGVLSLVSGFDTGVYKIRAGTARPSQSSEYTPWITCSLDTWHIAFAWYDYTVSTLYCSLDNGAPVTLTLASSKIWYGNFTYWMSGPRFTGLIDNSYLWNTVLPSEQRTKYYEILNSGNPLV